MVRKRFTFHGRVQGVGFRYYAQYAADRHGVTGWVKNEYNGTVSMEIQGTESQIIGVLSDIENGRYIRIEHIDSRDIPLSEDERSFRVKY